MSFVAELKRRNVVRVAIAYLAGAWLLIQIADTVAPAFGWPEKSVDEFVFPPGTQSIASYDKSIAVLPFDDLSSDGDQAYFADGVAEEILNVLAQVEGLRVVSRSTSFMHRGPVDIKSIGEALGVSYVLEGSVRKAGNTVRVTAQLIDAASDAHVWSESFERELIDIFDIQDDVAETVSGRLEIAITKRHREPQKTDPETYALYLKAKHSFYSQTGNFTDFAEEVRLLRLVLERDPEFVPAMTLLVDVNSHTPARDREQREARRQERMQLIRDAYALDPDDAIANMYMGWNAVEETGDVAAGIPYLERSLRLEPSNVEVLRTASYVAGLLGRTDDAMMLIGEAMERDPLCIPCATMATSISMRSHRWEEAEAMLRRRIELDSNDVGGQVNLAFVMMETGRAEKALAIIDEYEPEENARLAFRSMALDKLGRHEEADENIAHMREQFGDDYFKLIYFYAGRQDVEQTLHWIGQAINEDPRVIDNLHRDHSLEFLADVAQWRQWLEDFGYAQQDLDKIEFEIPDFS